MTIQVSNDSRTDKLYYQNESNVFADFNKSQNFRVQNNTKIKSNTPEKKINNSNNGKFDVSEAAKNFFKGVLSPLTAIIKHPVMSVAAIGITSAACTLI